MSGTTNPTFYKAGQDHLCKYIPIIYILTYFPLSYVTWICQPEPTHDPFLIHIHKHVHRETTDNVDKTAQTQE